MFKNCIVELYAATHEMLWEYNTEHSMCAYLKPVAHAQKDSQEVHGELS